jgi:hypothetical protein
MLEPHMLQRLLPRGKFDDRYSLRLCYNVIHGFFMRGIDGMLHCQCLAAEEGQKACRSTVQEARVLAYVLVNMQPLPAELLHILDGLQKDCLLSSVGASERATFVDVEHMDLHMIHCLGSH